jgi:hypothetical protein
MIHKIDCFMRSALLGTWMFQSDNDTFVLSGIHKQERTRMSVRIPQRNETKKNIATCQPRKNNGQSAISGNKLGTLRQALAALVPFAFQKI